jgi:hypothetical protein
MQPHPFFYQIIPPSIATGKTNTKKQKIHNKSNKLTAFITNFFPKKIPYKDPLIEHSKSDERPP